MKVLVTGATGFLGSRVVPELRKRGHSVACLVRRSSIFLESLDGCTIYTIGTEGEGLRDAVVESAPDVVVHLAAHYVCEHRTEDIGPLIRTNVEFGVHLLDAMCAAGCSALVYTGTAWQHYRDQDYCPVNLYAATKQAFSTIAEYYLDAAGLRLLELHLYDSYGPNDPRPKLLNRLSQAALAGNEISMSGGAQMMHLVHVDDVSRGVALACEQVVMFNRGERRVYRLPSTAPVSVRDLVRAFHAANPHARVSIKWGSHPYRRREVFKPWERGDVLPDWRAEIPLESGLRELGGNMRRVTG